MQLILDWIKNLAPQNIHMFTNIRTKQQLYSNYTTTM